QYLQALCLVRGGYWTAAKVALTQCLGRQPEFYWARLLRATAHGQLNEIRAAEADFALALEQAVDPLARWAVLTSRGALWVRCKRWDDAVTDLRQAIKERPDAPEAYINLALAHQGRKDRDAALTTLKQALARRPNDPLLYHTRARLHLARKDWSAAERDLEQAIAHEPGGSTADRLVSNHVELGALRHQAGKYEAALEAGAAALRIRPGYALAHCQRAQTLLALGRYAEAGKELELYLRKGPPTAEVYLAQGLLHFQRRAYPEAIKAFNHSLVLRADKKTL